MKIAITGHTYGIGHALFHTYQKHEHEVIGFSRSNGYDISDPASRKKIIDQVKDVDIFINNAHDWLPENDFSEVKLLTELWQNWEGQHKKIVSISSSVVMRWEQGINCSLTYRASKRCLEDTCEFLWNKGAWPQITIVAPCLTDTPRTSIKPDSNKVDPNSFANLVFYIMSQPDFRVQVLKLAVNPV